MLFFFLAVIAAIVIMIALVLGYREVNDQCWDLAVDKQDEYYDSLTYEQRLNAPMFDASDYHDRCIRANWIVIDPPEIPSPIKVREP